MAAGGGGSAPPDCKIKVRVSYDERPALELDTRAKFDLDDVGSTVLAILEKERTDYTFTFSTSDGRPLKLPLTSKDLWAVKDNLKITIHEKPQARQRRQRHQREERQLQEVQRTERQSRQRRQRRQRGQAVEEMGTDRIALKVSGKDKLNISSDIIGVYVPRHRGADGDFYLVSDIVREVEQQMKPPPLGYRNATPKVIYEGKEKTRKLTRSEYARAAAVHVILGPPIPQ